MASGAGPCRRAAAGRIGGTWRRRRGFPARRNIAWSFLLLRSEFLAVFLQRLVLELLQAPHHLVGNLVDLLGNLVGDGLGLLRPLLDVQLSPGALPRRPARPTATASRPGRGAAPASCRRSASGAAAATRRSGPASRPRTCCHSGPSRAARRPLASASPIPPGRRCTRPAGRPDSRVRRGAMNCMRWSRFRSTLPSTMRIGLELGGRLQGEAADQLAAADVEQATVADGEAQQAIGPEGPGLVLVGFRRRGSTAAWRTRPWAAWRVGTRPGVEVSICAAQAWRCSFSQAAKASARFGIGHSGHDRVDQHVGPCAGEDGRGNAVGDDGDSALAVGPAGVLVFARVLGVLGRV